MPDFTSRNECWLPLKGRIYKHASNQPNDNQDPLTFCGAWMIDGEKKFKRSITIISEVILRLFVESEGESCWISEVCDSSFWSEHGMAHVAQTNSENRPALKKSEWLWTLVHESAKTLASTLCILVQTGQRNGKYTLATLQLLFFSWHSKMMQRSH